MRDGKSVQVEHKRKPHHNHHQHEERTPADPAIVLKVARDVGYEPLGEPRRKSKHFEVLGRRDGAFVELHVELDGRIRKTRPVAGEEPK
jgi:hypothetical protein